MLIAVACHQDEPGVGETVRDLLGEADAIADARVLVCVNGAAPRNSLAGRVLEEIAASDTRLAVDYLDTPSKPQAWNRLRANDAEITVFCDADVTVKSGSVELLVSALRENTAAAVATARQRPSPPIGFCQRVAVVPFRHVWGGIAGTLYAARTVLLPLKMPDDVLLDDAWLWAQVTSGQNSAVIAVPEAEVWFRAAGTCRDLWHQRLRAEAGKRQLRSWGSALAPASVSVRRPASFLRAYRLAELPAVVTLATIKVAAALFVRFRHPEWGHAASTKPPATQTPARPARGNNTQI